VGFPLFLPEHPPEPMQNRAFSRFHKDNMGWSDWEEFRRLTTNDKTNLQEQK
jgi:hypothetical protein